MSKRKIITILALAGFIGSLGVLGILFFVSSNLPKIVTIEDYDPLVISEVYDQNGEKVGEFFRERRKVRRFEEIPKQLSQAFIAAEDSSFYEHSGINFVAILRAVITNIRAGEKRQGASTITQQVARTLFLSSRKTYTRKIKEVLLALEMERNLSKEEILFLYMNQIYLGSGSYGVAMAAETYFRKPLNEINVAEMALLASLPKAPSRFSPIYNPERAKIRQLYVLNRMGEEGFLTEEEVKKWSEEPLQVYLRESFGEKAPYYVEAVRQQLVEDLGETEVLNNGLRVHTALDLKLQEAAQESLKQGLHELDKRQGFRGSSKNMTDPQKIAEFLLETRNQLMDEKNPLRTIYKDGSVDDKGPLDLAEKEDKKKLPEYIAIDDIVEGIVTKVDDEWGLTTVRFAESQGLIDIETMKWAREPDPKVKSIYDEISKPSEALKVGDIISIKVLSENFYSSRINQKLRELRQRQKKNYKRPETLPDFSKYINITLEQKPLVQGAIVSIDLRTQNILAMVGGYNFNKSELNRVFQATRQTGSSFKPLVYASAFDKGFKPNTVLIDAPIVYDQDTTEGDLEGQTEEIEIEKWKPGNYSSKFGGDILFRDALKRSKNIPTIKVSESVGISWVIEYSRRLGIFSPLNRDLSLGLGSSSVKLYEMTKVFGHIARLGKRMTPYFIQSVKNSSGEELLSKVSLDARFKDEINAINEDFEAKRVAYLKQSREIDNVNSETNSNLDQPSDSEKPAIDTSNFPPIYFEDPDQLISKQTAYLISSLLQAAVAERGGTGGKARALGRPAAGKTGTTNAYYDAWFIGYTPEYVTGVWVGYDNEKTLGIGETGGSAALPIWLEYMKVALENKPVRSFQVPPQIVFANIDSKTGQLASATSEEVYKQAFLQGTEPKITVDETPEEEDSKDFYRQDLGE